MWLQNSNLSELYMNQELCVFCVTLILNVNQTLILYLFAKWAQVHMDLFSLIPSTNSCSPQLYSLPFVDHLVQIETPTKRPFPTTGYIE